ncbi:MAG TPA: TonB family protein [Methylophilaceae bacterium]|jgi:protein TonB|nr:TonB family protein [Methylophilaceae bacterium]
MSTTTMSDQGAPVPSEKMVWLKRIGLALVVLACLYGLWFAVKGLFEPHTPQKKQITKIKILPDTPPPPPPPPKEPPKEQQKEQPKEVKMEQPKPQEVPEPPAEALKMEGAAGDGPSPFSAGPVTNDYKGGEVATKIGGKKSMAAYAWFTGQVKTRIEDALEAETGLSRAQYRIVVHVWISPDGQVERSEVQGSSGDAAIDALIKKALAGLGRVGDAPPDDMPQPVKLRITSKNTG